MMIPQYIIDYNRTKTKTIRKVNLPNEILDFMNFLGLESYSQLKFMIEYNIESIPLCPVCYQPIKNFHLGRKFCSSKYSNSSPLTREKVKETVIERYGVENPMQSEIIQNKCIQTNLKRYGVKNPNQIKQIRDKIKQTNLDRYGCEYPSQSNTIKEKIKQTNLERYGVDCTLKDEAVKREKHKSPSKNLIIQIISSNLIPLRKNPK